MGLRQSAILTSSTKPISGQWQSIQEKNDFGFHPAEDPELEERWRDSSAVQVKRLFCDLTLDQKPNAGPTLTRINVKRGQNFGKQGRNLPRQVR